VTSPLLEVEVDFDVEGHVNCLTIFHSWPKLPLLESLDRGFGKTMFEPSKHFINSKSSILVDRGTDNHGTVIFRPASFISVLRFDARNDCRRRYAGPDADWSGRQSEIDVNLCDGLYWNAVAESRTEPPAADSLDRLLIQSVSQSLNDTQHVDVGFRIDTS